MTSVLFADDTTVTEKAECPEVLINKFKSKLESLLEWVKYNQLTINWSKTKFMFVFNSSSTDYKSIIAIKSVKILGFVVEVVTKFKLLGIVVDSRLQFKEHIIDLKKRVNKRLYSIKKIFYLSQSVKNQFFKTFILPHFDYCLALVVYLTKMQVENLAKFYSICLYRLLGIKLLDFDVQEQKERLEKFLILPFKYRICYRISMFVYKIMNKQILSNFYSKLVFKDSAYFRCRELVDVPDIRTNYGRLSLTYFLPRFVNNVMKSAFHLEMKMFKQQLNSNLNLIFENFCKNFNNFS